MAIPFLNNINLDDNQLLNAKLHVTSSAPTAAAGQIYFDSTASVTSAKYYDGAAWISLIQHTYNNGAFINLTEAGTDATRTLTAELSAAGTPDATVYLRGDNTWSPISGIVGTTYDLDSIQVGNDVAVTLVGSDATLDTVTFVAGTNITLTDDGSANITIDAANPDQTVALTGDVTGTGTTSIATTISAGAVDFAMLNSTDVITSVEGIENNDNDVTIPTSAAVKAYADSLIVGGLIYQGGFDGSTGYVAGTTNYLDDRGTQIAVNKGWTYTVTVAGTFYGEVVEVGDVLIAEDNLSSGTGTLADWTTVQNNVDLASLTQVGIGNVNASTDSDKVGLYVNYSSGTANIGVDIDSLTQGLPAGDNTDSFLFYYDDTATQNKKITFAQLSTEINTETSFSGTIGNGSATSIRLENSGASAPNIDHGLGTDSTSFMIQLVDVSSGETVYADVTRGAGGQVTIDFAAPPATLGIRVLIQKIG